MSRQREPTLLEILKRMVMIKQRTGRMVMIKQRTGMTNLINIGIRQLRLMRQS